MKVDEESGGEDEISDEVYRKASSSYRTVPGGQASIDDNCYHKYEA